MYAVEKNLIPRQWSTILPSWAQRKSSASCIETGSKREESESEMSFFSSSAEEICEKLDEKEMDTNANSVIPKFSSSVSEMITIPEEVELQNKHMKKQMKDDPEFIQNRKIIQELNNEMKKLKKDYKKAADKERMLMKETDILKEKLMTLAEAKKDSDSCLKDKVKTLEDLVEEKNTDVKWLWNEIRMLHDEYIKLKVMSSKWVSSKNQLKKEIVNLRLFIVNNCPKPKVHISSNAANWKEKMDIEISALGTMICPSHRWKELLSLKGSVRGKFGGWPEKRMKKPGWYTQGKQKGHVPHKSGTENDQMVPLRIIKARVQYPSKDEKEFGNRMNNKASTLVSALFPHRVDC